MAGSEPVWPVASERFVREHCGKAEYQGDGAQCGLSSRIMKHGEECPSCIVGLVVDPFKRGDFERRDRLRRSGESHALGIDTSAFRGQVREGAESLHGSH